MADTHAIIGTYDPRERETQGTFNVKRVKALEDLREVAGMYCEQLPYEVREALHRIPGLDKTHQCDMTHALLDETGKHPS